VGVDYLLVLEVANVLYRITYYGVVVECRRGELPRKLVLLDLS